MGALTIMTGSFPPRGIDAGATTLMKRPRFNVHNGQNLQDFFDKELKRSQSSDMPPAGSFSSEKGRAGGTESFCWKQAAPKDVALRMPLNGIGGAGGAKRRCSTLHAQDMSRELNEHDGHNALTEVRQMSFLEIGRCFQRHCHGMHRS